jgi:hypothetical protein
LLNNSRWSSKHSYSNNTDAITAETLARTTADGLQNTLPLIPRMHNRSWLTRADAITAEATTRADAITAEALARTTAWSSKNTKYSTNSIWAEHINQSELQ